MTALACLRILNDPDRIVAGVETPTPAVRRVVSAWLVGRWLRPNRFGEVAPGVFVLAEPGVDRLGVTPLVSLARELRHAPVSLAALQGDQAGVTRFAALHSADLRAVLGGLMVVDGMTGLVSAVTPTGVHRIVALTDHRPLRLIMDGAPLIAATRTVQLAMAG